MYTIVDPISSLSEKCARTWEPATFDGLGVPSQRPGVRLVRLGVSYRIVRTVPVRTYAVTDLTE